VVHGRRVKNQTLNVCVRVTYDPVFFVFVCTCLCLMDQMLPRPATPGEALLIQQNTMLFQENCAEVAERTGVLCSMEKCSRGEQPPQHSH